MPPHPEAFDRLSQSHPSQAADIDQIEMMKTVAGNRLRPPDDVHPSAPAAHRAPQATAKRQ
jgi:hypothetical protein